MSLAPLASVLALSVAACAFDGGGLAYDDGGLAGDGRDQDGDARRDGGNERTTLGLGDMRLVYGEIASDRIHSQRWSLADLDWTPDLATESTAGAPLWPVSVIGPGEDPDELLVSTLRRAGGHRIVAHTWNGAGWTEAFGRDTALSIDSKRSFDLAFERRSGHALVVYAADTDTPVYRTFTGGSWSGEITLPINDGDGPQTNGGLARWIELESHPGSNRIGLVFSDSERDLVAMVWDGDTWLPGSIMTLETNLKQNDETSDVANRVFDLAFESQSGDLLVAWGQEGQSWPWYQLWSSTAGSWLPASVREAGIVSGHPHYVDLAPDPTTDRIAGGFYDLGDGIERLGAAIWSGSSWIDKDELDSQLRDVNDGAIGDMPGAMAWLHGSGVAVCIYADAQAGTLDWARWQRNQGWTVQSDVAFPGKGFTESMQMRATPAGDRLVVLLSDDGLNLYTTTYNGSSWQVSNQGQPLSSVLAASDAVPFSLAVRR